MVPMETTTHLHAGDPVIATTATGAKIRMRAVRPPEAGRDFPVVWLATEEEFARAEAQNVEPEAIPWPLDAVTLASV